jgi:Leucine-rich repeat (LRR) protein
MMAILNANLLELNRGDFKNATRLTLFATSLNNLTTLKNWTFEGCPNIGILGFTEEYSLATLEPDAFKGLKRVTQLIITNGILQSLPIGIFDDLASLSQLKLDAQRLKTLPVSLFKFNTKIVLVSIYGNQLTDIPVGIFDPIKNFVQLDLSYNFLTKVSTFNATAVDFKGNRLNMINITEGTENIYASNNSITRIGCIGNMSGVQVLSIKQNKLRGIQCIGKMHQLTNLDISNNLFAKLSRKRFLQFTKMKYLDVFNNAIKNSKPRVFSGSKQLQTLSIDKLLNYKPLKKMFPKLASLSLSTMNWTCNDTENVAKLLRPQSISIQFQDEYVKLKSFKCRIPSSQFNLNP